jgi:hypothetical protein
MNKFNLSEKIENQNTTIEDMKIPYEPFIFVEDVKEFIRLLKEYLYSLENHILPSDASSISEEIDTLAGKQLVEDVK